jgi:hypothetical protein
VLLKRLTMANLPIYTLAVFLAATLFTLYFFCTSSPAAGKIFLVSAGWLAIQAVISLTGFYTVTDTIPPRLLLAILPPIVMMIVLFNTVNGKRFIDQFDIKTLTILNSVRVLVEFVLIWLMTDKTIPEFMTFEGRNFDIISGLTAPLVYYFGFVKKTMSRKWILAWNFMCLALVLGVVVQGILSVPGPIQQLGFDQPNIAILYFPIIWLPAFIVPVVIFTHLVSVRKLFYSEELKHVQLAVKG